MNVALIGDVTPKIYDFIRSNYTELNVLHPDDNVTENDWSSYDAVFYFESTQQDDLLDKWMGHPHLRFIKSNDEGIVVFLKQLDVLINNIELEKKYLIEYPNINELNKYPVYKCYIEQTYLLCKIGSHRVRKRVNSNSVSYHETLKIRINDSKCIEHESIISESEFNTLMQNKNPDKNTIVKDRYMFLYDGQYFELDIYPFWQDKAVLELELYSANQQITLPPEIKLIKDVSDDYIYKNNYLAGLKL